MTAPAPTLNEQIAAVERAKERLIGLRESGLPVMTDDIDALRATAAALRGLRDKLATPASTEATLRCSKCGCRWNDAGRRAEDGKDQSAAMSSEAIKDGFTSPDRTTDARRTITGDPAADPTRAALVARLNVIAGWLNAGAWPVGENTLQAAARDVIAALAQIVADGETLACLRSPPTSEELTCDDRSFPMLAQIRIARLLRLQMDLAHEADRRVNAARAAAIEERG